jgi:hypothetical protein
VGDVARFNPFFDALSLVNTTGWISWGTADERVNYLLDEQLAGELSNSVAKVQYTGQDRSMNAQNVADIMTWLNSLH